MTDPDEIRNAIIEILQPHAKVGQDLAGETQLVADMGLDSVQVMELLTEVEDRFDISIPLNLLPEVRSIDDLCEQIRQLTAAPT
jgi:acyl carrier protein